MIEIIDVSDSIRWDRTVTRFQNYDVYYINGYAKAFEIHNDGIPFLLYYSTASLRAICVLIKRDIASDIHCAQIISHGEYYDAITPYGYGGFIFEGDINSENIALFYEEYCAFMRMQKIVATFIRYHPQLNNADCMKSVSNVIDLGKTIDIDLASNEVIWNNIISKNRNAIRRAQKFGVQIKHTKDIHLFDQFMDIYNGVMDRDCADSYYYFEKEFYLSIHNDLYNNYEMFYGEYNGEIIAMSIMLYANQRMHYHLSGTMSQYRNLAPTNLLLYEAALWGCSQGFKTLHLGGGLGSEEDNLYKFKAAFNRNSDNRFSIGKQIFIPEIYDKLVRSRCIELKFDSNASFFPLYRA